MLLHALAFFVVFLLLRRSFQRAFDGTAPLKTQRSFWPLVLGLFLFGASLAARVLWWAWTRGWIVLVAVALAMALGVLWQLRRSGADASEA